MEPRPRRLRAGCSSGPTRPPTNPGSTAQCSEQTPSGSGGDDGIGKQLWVQKCKAGKLPMQQRPRPPPKDWDIRWPVRTEVPAQRALVTRLDTLTTGLVAVTSLPPALP